MCNCKADMEKMVRERFIKQFPDETNHEGGLTGYLMVLKGDKMIYRPSMPYTGTYDHHCKSGRVQRKKFETFIAFSNCPFCGEKVIKGEEK